MEGWIFMNTRELCKKIFIIIIAIFTLFMVNSISSMAANAPQIVDYQVVSGEHEDSDEEQNQTIIVKIIFDQAIQIGENAKDDLQILIAGGDVSETARNITFSVDETNPCQLNISMVSTGWSAIYNGLLNINASNSGIKNITSTDGVAVEWTNLETYIPIGIILENNRITGTNDVCASTTVQVTHKANMRGMYHVQFLSNQNTVIEDNVYYAGSITSHAHAFYTSITKEAIAANVSAAFKTALEEKGYSVNYDEGSEQFTITANEPKDGEILTVQMYEYNADGRTVDSLLKKAIVNAQNALQVATYTESSRETVQEAIIYAESLINNHPSLKQQADAKEQLKTAIAALEEQGEQSTEQPTEQPTEESKEQPEQKPVQKLEQKLTASSMTKTFGDKAFKWTAKTTGDGQLSYTSSNKKVAVISKSGTVTIQGAGKTVITIKASETDSYKSAKITVNLTVKKAKQKLTVGSASFVKAMGNKGFSLKVKNSGTGKLSYKSSDKKVVIVDKNGKVTIKGVGSAKITVTASGNANYTEAVKNITIKITPKTVAIIALNSKKAKTLDITWKKDTTVTGYQIYLAYDKKFTKNVMKLNVKSYKTVAKTVKSLKSGKTVFVKVRAYKTVNNKKVYGDFGNILSKKIK